MLCRREYGHAKACVTYAYWVHVRIQMCVYGCVSVKVYATVCVRVYMHVHVYLHVYLHVYVYVYISAANTTSSLRKSHPKTFRNTFDSASKMPSYRDKLGRGLLVGNWYSDPSASLLTHSSLPP